MGRLDDSPSNYVYCPRCSFVLREQNGILRALRPGRESHFRQFVSQYETVRVREGRGSTSPNFYTALPFRDLTGNNTWEWKIRCRTFLHAVKHIFSPIEATHPQGLDHSLEELVNSRPALQSRRDLNIEQNPICRRCVCSLHIPQTG
jgi:hypothetical protein